MRPSAAPRTAPRASRGPVRLVIPRLPRSVVKRMNTRESMDEAAAVSDVSAHTYAWKPLTNQHPIARAFSASDFRDILLAKVAASAHEEVADQSPMERLRDGT